jgi:hypothetical protein
MQEILARHAERTGKTETTSAKAEILDSPTPFKGSSVPAEPKTREKLKWSAYRDGTTVSKDTIIAPGYAILRAARGLGEHCFIAFKIVSGNRTVIGSFNTANEARACCEENRK